MPRRQTTTRTDEPALIPWEDTQPQIDVLDWRARAADFGLAPGEREAEEDGNKTFSAAERLLANEEPEADLAQPIDDTEEEEFSRAVLFREAPDEGLTTKDVDPVRAYLVQIGKTKLLTAQQEVQIGQQMENARAETLVALAHVPCAVCCLIRLATRVRNGEAPAAELILLPEGRTRARTRHTRPECVFPGRTARRFSNASRQDVMRSGGRAGREGGDAHRPHPARLADPAIRC